MTWTKSQAPKIIDYLSLDVEGAESMVFQNFDWDLYKFKFLTIERPKDDLKYLLNENGYREVRKITSWGETLWINQDLVSLTIEHIDAIIMLLKHPFLTNSIEGLFEDQSEFRHETLAVLVSGAGSSEVNGCYLLKGGNGNAWEFEFDNSITGRTFEMFKVNKESGWWNIMERVTDNSSQNPPHYGVEGDTEAYLPPVDGWGSVEYSDSWLGMDPVPIVEVTDRKVCLSRNVAKRT